MKIQKDKSQSLELLNHMPFFSLEIDSQKELLNLINKRYPDI